jgi:anti-sigma B factor antagonist
MSARELDFSLTVEYPAQAVCLVTIAGEADLHDQPRLTTALDDAIARGCEHVVVDVSDAAFVDSSTLGALTGAWKRLQLRGGTVTIVGAAPHIRKVIEITGLSRTFLLRDRLEDVDVAAVQDGAAR